MSLEFNNTNQNITCFRGDTGSITIRLKGEATYSTGDSIVMTVKKGTNVLFTRTVTEFLNDNKDAIIYMSAEDTDNDAGVYKYSIIYNVVDGQVHHIIPNICDGTNPTFKICEA